MRVLEMIQYPGKVENVDRMIATLGGITRISQSLGGEQKHMDLRFHPQNPYSKGICGEGTQDSGLLLSVRVRRSKRHPQRAPKYEVCILGHCQTSYIFQNLCDFQYLPLFKRSNDQGFTFDMQTLVPQNVSDIEYFGNHTAPLFTLPTQFARTETVNTNIFRDDTQEDGQQAVLGVSTKTGHDYREFVSFNMVDVFPMRADPQLTKGMKIKYVSDEQLATVQKLFDECPIWTRVALLHESQVTADKIKCILPFVSYFFSTGPWRTLYVRYGYDPRKDFHSRHYQTFDFRLRYRSGVAQFVANRRETIKKLQANPYDINELTEDINYPYLKENKLPRSRQCIFRFCDIHIPKIQEMLEKLPSPLTGATCNERSGWLPESFNGQVRQVVNNSIKEVLRNHYRKDQMNEELEELDQLGEEEEDEGEEGEEEEYGELYGGALDEELTKGEMLSLQQVEDIFVELQNENAEDNDMLC